MRSATFNLETGQLMRLANDHDGAPSGLTGQEGARIAAECLPGTTPELIDAWYSEYMSHDDPAAPGHIGWIPDKPEPFAVGSTVTHREAPGLTGRVAKRVVTNGELHTVWVGWNVSSDSFAPEPYSPSQLTQP